MIITWIVALEWLARKTVKADPKSVPYILGGIALFVVVVLVLAYWGQRKHREALAQLALELGFSFSATPDPSIAADVDQIPLPSHTRERRVRYTNVFRGVRAGLMTIVADRIVGAGKHYTATTIVAFKFDRALPKFMVAPENPVLRLMEKFGFADIDLPGAPQFSQQFLLRAEDEAAVRNLFTPMLTSAFEQLPPQRRPIVTFGNAWLVVSTSNATLRVRDIPQFIQQAETLASTFRQATSKSAFAD